MRISSVIVCLKDAILDEDNLIFGEEKYELVKIAKIFHHRHKIVYENFFLSCLNIQLVSSFQHFFLIWRKKPEV